MAAALIFGPTGLIGNHLLDLLLADPNFASIICLGRRPPEQKNPKLHFLPWPTWPKKYPLPLPSFPYTPNPQEIPPALSALLSSSAPGQALHAFCALGTTMKQAKSKSAFQAVDYHLCLQAAEVSAALHAQSFHLVTSHGTDPNSPNFYLRTKGQTEAAIQNFPFPQVHGYRPSFLLGQRPTSRPGEVLIQKLAPFLSPLLHGPLKNLHPISGKQVARFMLEQSRNEKNGHFIHPSSQMLEALAPS